jgi:hypothetical protein
LAGPLDGAPPRAFWRIALAAVLLVGGLLSLGEGPVSRAASRPQLRALLVGGGPDRESNQVGIESNVRYVARVLPSGAKRTILFADGNPREATVQFDPQGLETSRAGYAAGEEAYSLIFAVQEETGEGALAYRAPKLPSLDGPAQKPTIARAFDALGRDLAASRQPVLLYFTGHGSQGDDDSVHFDLWGNSTPLSVRDLAADLARIPAQVPVALVMVQCFSGGFANLLFEGGNPEGALVDRDLAGYFAATAERMSSGCTPSLDEADYQDFTSYFFAALSGRDRVGRKVSGVDYNHDGRVGMDEAFAYVLVSDEDIDVPTCTSDGFLRRFVPGVDEEVFRAGFPQTLSWATPAQAAALQGLSRKLNLTADDRLSAAYTEFRGMGSTRGRARRSQLATTRERLRRKYQAQMEAEFPALRDPSSQGYADARKRAIRRLDSLANSGALADLLQAEEDLQQAREQPQYTLRQTRILRLLRLAKSVILAHRLESAGDQTLLTRYHRLRVAEERSLL